MKGIKKLVAVMLVLATLTACMTVLASAEGAVQPRWTLTGSLDTQLSFSNDVAIATIGYECYESSTLSVRVTSTLQKKFMLFWWTDLTTWTDTSSDYIDVFRHTYETSSGTHRLLVTFEVTDLSTGYTETIEDEVEVKN